MRAPGKRILLLLFFCFFVLVLHAQDPAGYVSLSAAQLQADATGYDLSTLPWKYHPGKYIAQYLNARSCR